MNKQLLVVLGMHRSGTSALTRGLTVLGVELGDTLMPAKEHNNAKGFWEDVDINELNIELMSALDHSWDSLAPLTAAQCNSEAALAFLPRAKDLLQQKIADHAWYGMKDPRVSVLLPFWQRVFGELGLTVHYVIALRSPLSVASSLAKRDAFVPERSHYLWLQYMLASLQGTKDCSRLVVDFDLLMAEPAAQLARIARLLAVEFSPNSPAFVEYSQQFLDPALRHVSYSQQDTEQDPVLPNAAKALYRLLLELAKSELTFDDARYSASLGRIYNQFTRLVPTLCYLNQVVHQLDQSKITIAESKITVSEHESTIAAHQSHIKHLEQHAEQLGQTIASLVAHQEGLGQVVAEQQRVQAEQQQALLNKDMVLAEQQQALEAKDQHVLSLQMQVAEHQMVIMQMQRSASWRLTAGLRGIKRVLKHQQNTLRDLSTSSTRFIQSQGGLVTVTKKAWAVCQRDGIKSLPRHVRHSLQTLSPETFERNDYANWVRCYDTLDEPRRSAIRAQISDLQHPPLISVIMPVYNAKPELLSAAVASVQQQLYPHWQLCIADDASTDPAIRRLLAEVAAADERIKVVFREHNGHISAASNSALELVTADWVALMDHDDMLPEHALFHVAHTILDHPNAAFIYSDEDKIDQLGNRSSPHFKSDWNPELFFSQNYVSHLGVYKKSILDEIGGFRLGLEGSQDYDLLLRCLPHISHEQIIHIPKILYHWRVVEGSTALSSGEKNYTTDAGVRALQDYFASQAENVTVSAGQYANTYRVDYAIAQPEPLVSLLIPTRDGREITEICVRSILDKSTYRHFEILILDNGSVEDDTLAFFEQIQREDARVKVLRYDHPFNYSAINNFGAAHAQGDIIGLVNNDIEVITPEWLTEMVSQVMRPEVGCVGAKLYYGNDTLQHGGVIVGLGGVAGHSHKHYHRADAGYYYRLLLRQTISAVTAACLLVRREVFEQVQGLDEQNLKVAFNDVDFCLKVREAGYRNVWTSYAELYHHESISRGPEDTPEKIARFEKEITFMKEKWGEALVVDPYYSPNLTLDYEDFSMAWPPRLKDAL